MAYELALVWSCLCGILVIYFLWALKVKKSTSRSKQKPTRKVILEATSKRVSSVKHSEVKNALDSVDFMKQEPIVETKGAENGSSKLKGKQHEDSLHDHRNLVESNIKKGQSRIYHVKVCQHNCKSGVSCEYPMCILCKDHAEILFSTFCFHAKITEISHCSAICL